jgi:hypothetical protein
LHPALQSELADVFIEASNEFRTLVVETHSEHLLLRLLRRIRQTARGQLNTPELMLRSKDVTVLYFDRKWTVQPRSGSYASPMKANSWTSGREASLLSAGMR